MEVNCDVVSRVIELLEHYESSLDDPYGPSPEEGTRGVINELKALLAADPVASLMSVLYDKRTEDFVVKHYSAEGQPTIKGNGFDGIEIGADREEAEGFIKWVNGHIVRPYLIEAHQRRIRVEAANRCRSVANYYTLSKSRLAEGSDERKWCIASEQAADQCVRAVLGEPGKLVFGPSPTEPFRVTINGMNEDVSVVGNGFNVVVGGVRTYDKVADLFKWINRQIEKTRQ